MTELRNAKQSVLSKAFAVITCAIMTGFMWRVRGEHGWGSMWGMFAVGVMLILFIYAVFGERKKMNFEMIPLAVFFLGITNGGWGTLNSQMSGYLTSTAAFTGEEFARNVEINPVSGLFMMLFLGFGWMPLFAVIVGSLFSKKKYGIKEYVILFGVFFVVEFICKYTVSHFVLQAVHPEAVSFCKEGLIDRGIVNSDGEALSPMMAYIKEMGSAAWAKKIPFARNYFTSIDVMSAAFGALATSVAAVVIVRDRFTAVISFLINTVCAVAITAADVFLIMDSDKGLLPLGEKVPLWLTAPSWSLWEFFTGFLLGFGIMLILVLIPKKYIEEEPFSEARAIKNNKLYYIYSVAAVMTFALVVTIARPFGMRIYEFFAGEENEGISAVITVLISIIAAVVFFLALKPLLGEKRYPLGKTPAEFCRKAGFVYFMVTAGTYFILDEPITLEGIEGSEQLAEQGISGFFAAASLLWNSGRLTVFSLMLIAFVLFFAFYVATMIAVENKND